MKEDRDFFSFLEKNMDPNMVIGTPRVLCQKLETVKARVERLEALDIKYSTLWIVCAKENCFHDFIIRWGPNQ